MKSGSFFACSSYVITPLEYKEGSRCISAKSFLNHRDFLALMKAFGLSLEDSFALSLPLCLALFTPVPILAAFLSILALTVSVSVAAASSDLLPLGLSSHLKGCSRGNHCSSWRVLSMKGGSLVPFTNLYLSNIVTN
jgi:hypothetical protein